MESMQKRVVIVGAGPGGLGAAMLLASAGCLVDVFEKQPYVGGRTSGFEQDGFRFDLGPTFLMMTYILHELFQLSGRRLEDYMTLQEIDPLYRLIFHDGREFLPTRQAAQMKAEMERLFPGSYQGYQRFLDVESQKFTRLVPRLRVPYSSWRDQLNWQFFSSLPTLDAHQSLHTKLGRYFSDEDLRMAFTFQAKYLGMSPWECPGTFSMIPYMEHARGIYHVMGGLQQITRGMAKAFAEDGGQLHLSTAVQEILVEKGQTTGVRLENGEIVKADDVIINADFAHAMTHLVKPEKRRKYTDERLRRKKYSCSTFMLYLGLDTLYDVPHHNVVFAEDYRKNVEEVAKGRALSADPSIYFQNASVTDPSLAPAGQSALYILAPVPNKTSGIAWDKELSQYRDVVLDTLERRAGLKDLRSHIVTERVLTPDHWEQEHAVFYGATFSLAHNIGQMLVFRPHNKFEEWEHCYLVGGGTHPGSGLPTIFESARISAKLILESYGQTLNAADKANH